MAEILVVDDELSITEILKTLLSRDGHKVFAANTGKQALDLLAKRSFDLMITDLKLPDNDGITLFTQAKTDAPDLPVIVMTAYGGVDSAVEAMRKGAFHYISKPFTVESMRDLASRALADRSKVVGMESAREKTSETGAAAERHFKTLIGESEPMRRIYQLIDKVAKTDNTVLIQGESGTGKELVARALHLCGERRDKPYISINCSAMPESLLESELFGHAKGAFTGAISDKRGLFKTADKGTIFLDEIGSVPLATQTKLLRVLQEKEIRPVGETANIPVDARVIAATNERLEKKIQQGLFREDLYYRLNVIPFELPPLRDRKDDIPLLVSHFLHMINREAHSTISIDKEVIQSLMTYDWPGNIRELENLLKRLTTLCENNEVTLDDLPDYFDKGLDIIPLKEFLRRAERKYVRDVLSILGGDKDKAAEKLGVSLATFYRKYHQ